MTKSITMLHDEPENPLNASQNNQSYIFVFMLVGLITLVPLAIFNAIILLRKGIPNTCRLIFSCVTLGLGSAVSAMILINYTLAPIGLRLARGDQLLMGQSENGFLVERSTFRAIACNQITILSDQLGIVAWSISVSVNRGSMQNYSLIINEWELPNNLHLRLNRGDTLAVVNYTSPVRAVILKGGKAWKKWESVNTYKLGYEKCCAWAEYQPTNSLRREPLEIDQAERYAIILRNDNEISNLGMKENNTSVKFNGAIHLQRIRWTPTPCDPIFCDGKTKHCQADNTPKRFVLEYTVEDMSAPPLTYANVGLICHPRYWMLGLLFGSVPIIILCLAIIIWRLKVKAKRMKNGTNFIGSTVNDVRNGGVASRYDRQNMAFELDIV